MPMNLSLSPEIPPHIVRGARRSALAKAVVCLAGDLVAERPTEQAEAAVQLAFADLLALEKTIAAHNNARAEARR